MSRSSTLLRAPTALLLGLLGCTLSPTPASPSAPPASAADVAQFADLSVTDVLDHFEEFALKCLGPEEPFPDSREWLCRQDYPDGSALDVRIVGNEAGVSQIVGIVHRASPDDAVSHLAGVVASLVVPEPEAATMRIWAADHPGNGRSWVFDDAAVELQAHSDARAVIVNPTGSP